MTEDNSMIRRNWIVGALCFVGSALFGRPVRGARYKARRVRPAAAPRDAPSPDDAGNGPMIIDVIAEERWPIRGLDPALYIGEAVLDSYQYGNAEGTILRFTCHDPGQLQEGAQVFVQYGEDTGSRTDLPDFRWADVVSE
jgi:hypothetical protein